MNGESDLKITITTVADVAGSDATASSLDRIQASAKRAGDDVDKAMRAADATKPLTELQKLEFELQKITAESKVLDAALSKIQSAGGSAPGLARQISQKDTQAEMLVGQISALSQLEEKGMGAAKAAEALTTATKGTGVAAGKTAEAIGYLARDLNDIALRGGRGAIGNTLRLTTALGGSAGLGAAIGGVAMGLAMLWPHLKKLWEDVPEPEALKRWKEHLDELRNSSIKWNNENATKGFDDWIASLSHGSDLLKDNSEELDRNIRLIQARRRAQLEVENAQDALDMEKIDSDKNMSEPDKIRNRAAIEERGQRRKEEERVQTLKDKQQSRSKEFGEKERMAFDKENAAAEAQKVADDRQKEVDELYHKRELAMSAQHQLPDIGKSLEDAIAATRDLRGDRVVSQREADEITALQKEVDAANAKISAYSLADKSRLANLEGSEDPATMDEKGKMSKGRNDRGQARDAAAKLRKEAEKARDALREEAKKLAEEEKTTDVEISGIRGAGIIERQKSGLHADTSSTDSINKRIAEDYAESRKRTDKAEKDADADFRRREGLGTAGTQAANEAHRLGAPEIDTNRLAAASKKLRETPNKTNEDAAVELLHQVLAWAERSGQNTDSKFAALQGRLKILENREKNTRDQ